MLIIKENAKYIAVDVRYTKYEGSYQILEKTHDFPNGKTCGVYFNKKDLLKTFRIMAIKEFLLDDFMIKRLATIDEKKRVFENMNSPQDIFAQCSNGTWVRRVWQNPGCFGWDKWEKNY